MRLFGRTAGGEIGSLVRYLIGTAIMQRFGGQALGEGLNPWGSNVALLRRARPA